MATTLDDLLTDRRLARLFSEEKRSCALQLWILQIKSENLVENRLIYGRLLPYCYSNNCWSFSNNDDSTRFGRTKTKITRLNLYISSSYCRKFLIQLAAGKSLSAISKELGIEPSKKLMEQFGTLALKVTDLAYRPAACLLNRDANDEHSLSSPHGTACAFSASITQVNKKELFRLGDNYSEALTSSIVAQLDKETGLDFGKTDITRFGDIELLVFPTLNDSEQNLLNIKWIDSASALYVRFNPMQIPHFNRFQFHLRILHDKQIISSIITSATPCENGDFECLFQINKELKKRMDTRELEIFGSESDSSVEGVLCCRFLLRYIKEIDFQGVAVGRKATPIKFDWLEKSTKPSMSHRVEAALTPNRGKSGFGSRMGQQKLDAWVPANHDLLCLFKRLHPPKSEGQFFLRYNQGDGEGRLQFVEWFKALLSKYQQHQIIIFDPYFDTAGLGLLLIHAGIGSDYIVFTSLPTASEEQDKDDLPTASRVNSLITNCKNNRDQLTRIKLRIYGLKKGQLHDRYILIIGSDLLPVAGFNLSNSLQNAAENYPLLVTPIPADALLQVERYKSKLVQDANQLYHTKKSATIRLLFDSTSLAPSVSQHSEPLRFLEKSAAGELFSIWCNKPSLKGLSGDQLKMQMQKLGFFKDNSFSLPDDLHNCINKEMVKCKEFNTIWEVLGEVLARLDFDKIEKQDFESKHDFLDFLRRFLKKSFDRILDNTSNELTVLNIPFKESTEELLHRPYRIDSLFYPIKYKILTWSEYFAIKIMWQHAPDRLLELVEMQISLLPKEIDKSEAVRLFLLSQIVSEISFSIQFGISKIQRDLLVRSKQGLLKWMGFNAIEQLLEAPDGLSSVLSFLEIFSPQEQIQALGWMIQHAAIDSNKAEIYKSLVAALHKSLPDKLSTEELKGLVISMQGHMNRLSWVGSWLFEDVIFPLLQNGRTTTEDVCDMWMQELTALLKQQSKNQSYVFDREREGQVTNIASYLFANVSPEWRDEILKTMNNILKRQQRIVQQPLACTSNWDRWNNALRVSLWILAFCKWSEFYLRERSVTDQALERLSKNADKLAMIRPVEEWQSEYTGKWSTLFSFMEEGDSLLKENNEQKDCHQ